MGGLRWLWLDRRPRTMAHVVDGSGLTLCGEEVLGRNRGDTTRICTREPMPEDQCRDCLDHWDGHEIQVTKAVGAGGGDRG